MPAIFPWLETAPSFNIFDALNVNKIYECQTLFPHPIPMYKVQYFESHIMCCVSVYIGIFFIVSKVSLVLVLRALR